MGLLTKTIDLDELALGETESFQLSYKNAPNGLENFTTEVVWSNMTANYAGSTIEIVEGLSSEALSVATDLTSGSLNYTTGATEVLTDTQSKASGYGIIQFTVTKGTGTTTEGGKVTFGVLYDGSDEVVRQY